MRLNFFTVRTKRLTILKSRNFMEKIEYFETRKGDYVDTYGDKKVADPYQWLEDPGISKFSEFCFLLLLLTISDSEETKKWVTDQIALTTKYIDGLDVRTAVAKRFRSFYNISNTRDLNLFAFN